MSRTVGSILLVAAAIAVNVIPGVGQAISAGLLSAGISVSAATAAAVTALAITTVGGLLLAPKIDLPQPETAETAIKVATPPRVSGYGRRRLFGAYTLFENTTFSVNSDVFAPYALDGYAVHDNLMDGIELRYLGDEQVTLNGSGYVNQLSKGAYGEPLVRWYETLGETPGAANWAEFIDKLPGKWTVNHRGDGVACLGIVWKPVSSDEFSERFPQGAAEASVVARLQRCFDPRNVAHDVADPDTWQWTENAVLHLLHYRLCREKAHRLPGEVLPSGAALQDAWDVFFEPTRDYWEEAADVCDEAVALKAGGTEDRYRSCFLHKHTDPHKDVLNALTACFDGWTAPRSDGALVVYAGKYYEPTVSIGPDEIVSYSWQYGVRDEEAVNEIKLTYVSADHDYNTVETDPWQDTDDQLSRGAIRSQGQDWPVPSHGQARRLAKRLIAKVMAANRGTVTTNVAGRIVRGERYINLRIAEAGAVFFDGVAEITGMTRNVQTGGVTFSWVEVTETIDAWNPATEEGDPAPTKTRTALTQPAAPVIDSAVLIFDAPSDSGTGARVSISLSGPSGTDLIWFARWRVVGDPIWNEQRYTDVDSSSGVELITDFVPIGEDVEVEVAYRHGAGALSRWSTPATEVAVDTEATAPDAAATPVLVEWTDRLTLSCPAIPRAKSYRWRFYLSDGTTLKRTITTTVPEVSYTKAQAHADGVSRSYKIDVAGVNSAGTGTASSLTATLSKAAPAAPTAVAFADGTSTSEVTFTPPGAGEIAGYRLSWSTVSGFNAMTQGSTMLAGSSPSYTTQLPAATYYGKVASYDLWSSQPDQINYSAEDSFVITPGGGGDPPAGGGGGGFEGGGGGGGGHLP